MNKPRKITFEKALDGPFKTYMSDFNAVAWRPFLRSLDGNPPLPDQRELFERGTGRTVPFTTPPRLGQACAGRRSGKTRVAALVASVAACFWDHSYLAKGERGRILLLSQTRDQAQVAKGYILATLESNRVCVTADTIALAG
jgi:hypothetical protein